MIVERAAENFFKIFFLNEYMVNHKGYIAGGCFKNIFNGEKIKDVDVFFENETDFLQAKKHFEMSDEHYHLFYENENVVAFKHKRTGTTIELCRKTYAPAKTMIENFDFTIAKFSYYKVEVPDLESGEGKTKVEYRVLCDDHYFEHLHQKRLVIDDKILFPMSTFERMIRYIRYGYMPCNETKLKIATAIYSLPSQPAINSRSLYDGVD